MTGKRHHADTEGGGHDSGDAVYRNTTLKNNVIGSDGAGIDAVTFINSKIRDLGGE